MKELQEQVNSLQRAFEDHKHTGTDSQKYSLRDAQNAPQDAISQVSGTAGATYGATEQAMLNNLTTAVNAIITTLQNLELTQ